MSRNKKDLNPILVAAFDKAVAIWPVKHPELPHPFLTCTNRSDEEQNKTFFIGRDATGKVLDKRLIVTNARAGQSPHNYNPSAAFDIGFVDSRGQMDWAHHLFEKFRDIICEIEPLVVWGYDWNGNKIRDKNDFDAPHFELKDWRGHVTTKSNH